MWVFRTFYAVDVLAVLVLAYFFVDGLRYASGASYFVVWLPLLAVPIAILLAAPAARRRGHNAAATALVTALAIPPLGFVLFFGLLIALNPRWN